MRRASGSWVVFLVSVMIGTCAMTAADRAVPADGIILRSATGQTVMQRVEARSTWKDLHVTDATQAVLRKIAAERRAKSKGGVAVLFLGADQAAKVRTVEVLAAELHLALYRVDLSAVVSPFLGETEKNLAQVFAAAERVEAVLFFDEADALFGKRTEVKDAHDRYANQEVSYLLQRIEQFEGLAILATNLSQKIDPAILRRFRHVVEFARVDTGATR